MGEEIVEGNGEGTSDGEAQESESSGETGENAADNLENNESFSTDESETGETQEAGGESQAETDSERGDGKDGKESRNGEAGDDTQEDLADLIDEVVAAGEREESPSETQGRCEPDLREWDEIPLEEVYEPYEWCEESLQDASPSSLDRGALEPSSEPLDDSQQAVDGLEDTQDSPPEGESGETHPESPQAADSTEEAQEHPSDAADEGELPESPPESPQITCAQIPDEVQRLRDSYSIPSPRGWSAQGRRIDLTHNPDGQGNSVRADDLLTELDNPRTSIMIETQLNRIEGRFRDLGRESDRSLLFHVAYRESGNTLTRSTYRTPVHTLGSGGMDYLGANQTRLEDEGLIQRGVISPSWGVNEKGVRVRSAIVPGNRLLEAYAARLAMANDDFRFWAREQEVNLDNLAPDVERAWTMIFFGQLSAGRAILQHLAGEHGRLGDILTDDRFVNNLIVNETVRVITHEGPENSNVNRYTVRILLRRSRVAAAEGDLYDRLREVIDTRLED